MSTYHTGIKECEKEKEGEREKGEKGREGEKRGRKQACKSLIHTHIPHAHRHITSQLAETMKSPN